jgi:2-C-methyl-D-erythritol 2,4-cyclodiphosphate synthase
MEMVEAAGYRLESVDATIIAERPALAPHLGEMRQRTARAMGADVGRVSVKATSSEGIGALGRGEGVAALAVALLAEGQ